MSWGRAILWCASLGALSFTVLSFVGTPPPLPFALAALLLYLGILVVLALVPRLEAFGDYLCRVPDVDGLVALTFDDGPDPRTTPRVLEALEQRGQRATFFVIGQKAEAHPELLRRIREGGHQLALHGYVHHRLYAFLTPTAVQQDIERAQDAVEAATGIRPALFRPPVGQASPRTVIGARRAGVALVGWSTRTGDGSPRTSPEAVTARARRGLRPGAILLLHDAPERADEAVSREPVTLSALPRILDALEEKGLRSVTLEELVLAAAPLPEPPRPPPAEARQAADE